MKLIFAIALMMCSAFAMAAHPGDTSSEEFSLFSKEICRQSNQFKDGLDSRLYKSCVDSMKKSLADVEELNSQYKESFYVDYAYPFCYLWSHENGMPNANSLKFCLLEEISATQDLKSYSQKFGFDKVIAIVNKEFERQKSWSMARNRVIEAFGPI